MTPRDFFYPRVALDFYQFTTTHQVRDPTVIHFTIDGHHCILGARHIVEALRILITTKKCYFVDLIIMVLSTFE